jgi:hypothetical protein
VDEDEMGERDMEEKGDACRAVDGKHEGERPCGKTWA